MDLKFYDEEKHSYFLDEYREYSREPDEDEKEFFKSVLEEAVSDIADVMDCSTDFKLYFAVTDEDALSDDLPINRFVHGFSFAEWMKGLDNNVIMFRGVKDRENWKDCLVNMLAHEMAHQQYYKKNKEPPRTNLENMIFEGHAMNTAEKIAHKLDLDWKPHYRTQKTPQVSAESVKQVLGEERTYEPKNIFQNGEEPCVEAEGYKISYLLVDELLNDTSTSLKNIPEIQTGKFNGKIEHILNDILK